MSTEHYDEYAFVAALYDHVGLYKERPDVPFFVAAAQESGGPVLEIGCGTGRVLVPTARAGVGIVGLDLSPAMLAVCRERLAVEPADVQSRARLVQADMRQFALGTRFALATVPFRPFQHLLTVDDQIACLRTIHEHLQPGGRLILDVFNPSLELLTAPASEEHGDEPEFSTPDGRRIVRRFRIARHDRFTQVTLNELIYYVIHPNGRQERLVHQFPFRYLFRFEIEHLLHRAGFTVEQLYADYDKRPYGSVYPGELIFVAAALPPSVAPKTATWT